jgi:co-chaperonin GroES (HSP10)
METKVNFEKLLQNTAETIIENNLEDICTDEVDILPCNANVVIKPYNTNPYRNIETTASGIVVGVESSKTYKSNETGEIEQNKDVIKAGKVLFVGPACKNVKVGEDVYYTTFSETPLPFRKKGYVVVGENLIICRIVKKGE